MNSKMVKCFDYRTLEVPQELRKWQDGDPNKEIADELERLARDYSREKQIESEICIGDSVQCTCTEAKNENWLKKPVLLFPGRNLPGAGDAEEKAVGKKAGDIFSCMIDEQELMLQVEKVIRRTNVQVGPELIELLQIPQVHTVEDYYRWYHEKHDPEKRNKACIRLVQYWLTEVLNRSEIFIDESEKEKWCRSKAELIYKGMLAAGVDQRKQEDGSMLTEEEALRKIAAEQEIRFAPFVIYEYFCGQDGFVLSEEEYRKELQKMAAERETPLEELEKQTNIQIYREVYYQEHTFSILCKEAEAYLEG